MLYIPAPGFTGTDGFAYAIAGGHGGGEQGTVTATVRNRPPLPHPDVAIVNANTIIVVPVLANDTDPDGHGSQ